MAETKIEWTNQVWNPVVGCSKVSEGCRDCYAETVHRIRLDGKKGYPPYKPWTFRNAEHNVTLMPHKLDQPLHWRRPRMVFVNSMSDLFHERLTGLPDERGRRHARLEDEPPRPDYIAEVFAVMSIATQHIFQVLTKRPQAMALLLSHPMFWLQVNAARMQRGYPVLPGGMSDYARGTAFVPNIWVGTSIENIKWIGRADWLRHTPGAVRFISAEPLLGPLVCSAWANAQEALDRVSGLPPVDTPQLDLTGIDWLIAGGESGSKKARPLDHRWIRDLRDACAQSNTALFVKQLGGVRPGTKLEDLPEDLRIREFPVNAMAVLGAPA